MRVQTKKVLDFGNQTLAVLQVIRSSGFTKVGRTSTGDLSRCCCSLPPRPHADIATRGMGVQGVVNGSGNTPEPSSQNCSLGGQVAHVWTAVLPNNATNSFTWYCTYGWHRPGGRTFISVRLSSSVSIVTWLAGRSEDRGSITGSTVVLRPALGRTQRAVQSVPMIKRPERESDLSPSSV